LTFAKADLNSLSDAERKLFVIAGHVSNEVGILQKLLVWSMNSKPASQEGGHGFTTQNLVIAKLLAGKLSEGWRVLDRFYFSGPSREYHDLLPDEARTAEGELRRYFGQENAIKEVRTNFAFHYSADEVPTILNELPDDFEFLLYLGDETGNSLYFFAEEPMFRQLLDKVPGAEQANAFDVFIRDVQSMARAQTTFFAGCMLVAMQKMFPGREFESVEIPNTDTADFNAMSIPFFFSK